MVAHMSKRPPIASAGDTANLLLCSKFPFLGGGKVKICYISTMALGLKELLEKAASWPEEDREELAEAAAEIEARRTGRYTMPDPTRPALNNGFHPARPAQFTPH